MTPLPFRALALDLDGTLLNAKGGLSGASARVLRELSRRGVRIVLASGRMTPRILPFADLLGLPMSVITFNGAEILEGGMGSWTTVSMRPWEQAAREAVLGLEP